MKKILIAILTISTAICFSSCAKNVSDGDAQSETNLTTLSETTTLSDEYNNKMLEIVEYLEKLNLENGALDSDTINSIESDLSSTYYDDDAKDNNIYLFEVDELEMSFKINLNSEISVTVYAYDELYAYKDLTE